MDQYFCQTCRRHKAPTCFDANGIKHNGRKHCRVCVEKASKQQARFSTETSRIKYTNSTKKTDMAFLEAVLKTSGDL